ncbi:MAG: rRNA maturation RNase YbeY [Pseudomonadota bacterium]
MSLTVQYATTAGNLPQRAQLRRWARAALAREASVTLRIVGQAEGRRLNRDFRGKDYATNVLTFVYDDDAPPGAPLCGDIVLCAPVVAREARGRGIAPAAHYAHLVVHAMLHLQGYEHETDAEAAVMEKLESAIVTRLGYADPYIV